MIPFKVYSSGKQQYLAITRTLGLKIGSTGLSEGLFRVRSPVLVKSTAVKLVIEYPSRRVNTFKLNIKTARERWIEIGQTGDLNARKLLFREVLAACSHFNARARRQYTLRDVAKLIGIRSFATFYYVLHLEQRRQLVGREKAIESAKDITLIQSVNNFRLLWPSIIGFSKKLDQGFKHELRLYTSTMRSRSLRI